MRKHSIMWLIGLVVALTMFACQSNPGTEAKQSEEKQTSEAGKVSPSQTPEKEFLKRIADAAEENDAKALASMLHPDVIASFGEEKCVEAFQQESPPSMVVAGSPVGATTAFWKNAEGRTQIYLDGPTYMGGVSMMDGAKMRGTKTFSFAADESGKFYLFADCSEKVFKVEEEE